MSARVSSAGVESPFGLMRAIDKFRPKSKGLMAEGTCEKQVLNETETPASRPKQAVSHRPAVDGVEQWPLPGLAPMTRVRTSFGDVHAIALRKGDEVLLRSGDYAPIQWINRIKLDEHVLSMKPDSNPVVFSPGSLGVQAPANEIMVSPRQIICADDKSGLSSEREAAMLVSRPGVRRLRETGLSYTMLHVGISAEVYCEGLYLRFPIDA
ncbi:MAG: hypothetical protein HKN27_06575 [Silicimonas sp.]|nr:hypothetical protein [Silicimonas sp.]